MNNLEIEKNIVNPLNDKLFKRLFGREENKESTIAYLDEILKVAMNIRVKDLKFKNVEIPPTLSNKIMPRLDILVETSDDVWINIEIQTTFFQGLDKRIYFYAASLFLDSLEEGDDYADAKKVIVICILDFIKFKDTKDYLNVARFRLDNSSKIVDDGIPENIYIEIPKLVNQIKAQNKSFKSLSKIERYLLFISNKLDPKQRKELSLVDSTLEVIYHNIKECTKNKIFVGEYMDLELERKLFKKQALLDAQAAEARGEAKGEARGEARGEAIGEAKERLKTVLRLLKLNLPLDIISRGTDLSIDEIKKIAFDNGLTI